jgi:hypothetical protein
VLLPWARNPTVALGRSPLDPRGGRYGHYDASTLLPPIVQVKGCWPTARGRRHPVAPRIGGVQFRLSGTMVRQGVGARTLELWKPS